MIELLDKIEKEKKHFYTLAFWSWNGKLDKQRLLNQIDKMYEINMGGIIIHARSGLITPYLSDEWFDCVRICVKKCQEKNMRVFIYDDQGWPSGFVGGKLLSSKKNLAQYLTVQKSYENIKGCLRYKISKNDFIKTDEYIKGEEYVYIKINSSPSNVDILNPKVVEKFISLTHNEYYKRLQDVWNGVEGFFTDEPQYYRYNTPYSKTVYKMFYEKYRENIDEKLPLLFYENDKSAEFRYKYYSCLNEAYTFNYTAKIHSWCNQHNCKLTGHTIEESRLFTQMWCCADVMPFYDNEDIPCVDSLCRAVDEELTVKQVGSVAAQIGKNEVLTETFACSGWDVTLDELKWVAINQYVGGVNMMTEHLYQYSFLGQRKKDHPPAFSKESPWYNEFKRFNEYFGKIGCLISTGKEICNTVVIHPIKSAYLTYDRKNDAESVIELDTSLIKTAHELSDRIISHHYADENILKKYAHVENNKLIIGECSYEFVVMPKLYGLDSFTVELLKKYLDNGGKLVALEGIPKYVDGEKKDLTFLKSNCSFEEISSLEIIRIKEKIDNIRINLRKYKQQIYALITNTSNKYCIDTEIISQYKKISIYDVETNSIYNMQDGNYGKKLHLEPRGACIVLFNIDGNQIIEGEKNKLTFQKQFTTTNYLCLDKADLSINNGKYQKNLPIPWIQEKLIYDKYKGKIKLRFNFFLDYIPKDLGLIFEKGRIKKILVNGKKPSVIMGSTISDEFYTSKISEFVNIGENTVEFFIDYYQNKNVYYAMFGENVTESLKNCLKLNTELEEIYISGDFNIKSNSGFIERDNGIFVSKGDFVITEPKISNSVNPDSGYPFFAGKVTYLLDSPKKAGTYKIVLKGRFSASSLIVNDEIVPCDMQGKAIINYVENTEIKVEIVSGNRNLFGPHHYIDEEPFAVSPNCFTMTGTWKNGKSQLYRNNFSFVKFGLEAVECIEIKNY